MPLEKVYDKEFTDKNASGIHYVTINLTSDLNIPSVSIAYIYITTHWFGLYQYTVRRCNNLFKKWRYYLKQNWIGGLFGDLTSQVSPTL